MDIIFNYKKEQVVSNRSSYFYAIYKIPNTIVNIANTIDNITVHLFCFPSLVLLLFFSKKLFVDEPVIVEDKPESSFDCNKANIIIATATIKYITINIHFAISMFISFLSLVWLIKIKFSTTKFANTFQPPTVFISQINTLIF